MKSIIVNFRPEAVASILSGEQTAIPMRRAPKAGLPITAYVYCREGRRLVRDDRPRSYFVVGDGMPLPESAAMNGKVVARFTLKHAREMVLSGVQTFSPDIFEKACMGPADMAKLFGEKPGYLWLVSDLEEFAEPKPLSEFGISSEPRFSWRYAE